jgi:serine/threonine protein kinase
MSAPPEFDSESLDAGLACAPQSTALADAACRSEDTATPQLTTARGPTSAAVETLEPALELEQDLILRGRYVLEDVVGRGGTSIVFRARDLHRASSEGATAEFVAVKLLRSEWRADPAAIERLRREFRQMQCLSHPGIVRVFDLDCDDNVWFMTMELVTGRTVRAWMQEPRGREQALRVIGACCDALEHAHALGFLHGDLKPTNVMVADDGVVKLIDFGSAPSPGSRVAARSNPMLTSTPLYASPQILAGKSGEIRDDVFSLACLSYGILSGGRHPFGRRPSLEDGRAKSAPTPVSAIPAGLFAVIERGLSAEREERPASAREFLRDLTNADRLNQPDSLRAAMARTNIDVLRDPGIVMQPSDDVTRLSSPVGIRSTTRAVRVRSAWPLVNLAALVVAIVGTAALIQPGTHKQATRSAEKASDTSAQSPIVETPAAAQAAVVPETDASLHDSGVISFEESTVRASAVQPLVAVSVKRLRATRSRGAFMWHVESGTAYPGVDYQRVQPQLVSFTEGQTVRTLFIPLINTRGAPSARRARTFTVALQPVAGGPALGRFDRVTVTIDPAESSGQSGLYQARAER